MKIPDSHRGFSLVELSVVLVIVGIIIGSSVSTGLMRVEAQRVSSTKERMQFLMDAIDQYVKRYEHLPCPADPTLEPTETNYGVGEGTNNRGGDGDPDEGACEPKLTMEIDTAARVFRGSVPFRDLGISEQVALDGWGNRFTYVVDEDLTFVGDAWLDTPAAVYYGYRNAGNHDLYDDQAGGDPNHRSSQGDIVIRNNEGVSGTDISTSAAYVIISHGSNASGAYTINGARLTASADANEAENTDDDIVYVERMPALNYDDILVYRNKWQINR